MSNGTQDWFSQVDAKAAKAPPSAAPAGGDDWFAQVDAKAAKALPPAKTPAPGLYNVLEDSASPYKVMSGMGKGAVSSVAGLSELMRKVPMLGRAIPESGVQAMRSFAQPGDVPELMGFAMEQAGEFVPGAMAAEKGAVKGVDVLSRIASLTPRERNVYLTIARMLGQGGASAGQTAIQGGTPLDIATSGFLGLAPETIPAMRAGFAGMTGKMLEPGASRMAAKPIESLTRPAETVTRQEAQDWARQHGIFPTAGESGGSKIAQFVQGVGETSLLRGEELQSAREKNVLSMQQTAEQFADTLDPHKRGTTEEKVGMHLQDSANVAKQVAKDNERTAYQELMQNVAPGSTVRIDLKPVRGQWGKELQDMKRILPYLPPEEARPLMTLLGYGAELGKPTATAGLSAKEVQQARITAARGVDLETAQKIRSFLWQQGTNEVLPNQQQATYRRMAHSVDDAIESSLGRASARGDIPADAFARWKQAHAMTAEIHEDFGPQGAMGKILRAPEASQASRKITAKSATPETIRTLRAHNVDVGPVKRYVFDQIRAGGFTLGRTPGISGYSSAFLKELFTPQEIREIYTMGQVARAIKYIPNPSETAKVTGVREQLALPVRMLAPAAASEATIASMRRPGASRTLRQSNLMRGIVRAVMGGESAARAAQ
jgi:hypothetical protein